MDESYILLVEDSPSEIALTYRAFERSGVTLKLIVKEDGQDAIDFLGTAPVLPVIVLLDLKLPRVDGLAVLRHIRASDRLRRVPVIMLSSSIEASDLTRCYDAGANSYIRKPVDFAEFEETMGLINRYWLQINTPPPVT
jgi:two-component system, response regulator